LRPSAGKKPYLQFRIEPVAQTVAKRVEGEHSKVVDDLIEENRVLTGQTQDRRLRLTADEGRRLVVKAKVPGRKVLEEVATFVAPDTNT